MTEKSLSASDVEDFVKCPRKWAFKRFEGVSKQASSAQLGTRCHTILEHYQTIGTLPDLTEKLVLMPDREPGEGEPPLEPVTHWPGQIVDAGIHLLPPPRIVEVEGAFKMRTTRSLWKGRKDGVYMRNPDGVPEAVNAFKVRKAGYVLVVQDHKTTKDKRYAKVAREVEPNRFGDTPEVLSKDVQCLLYLYDEVKKHDLRNAAFDWVYYRTKEGKPGAWQETDTLEAGYVIDYVENKIDPIAEEMHRLYRLRPKPQTLPPALSLSYCDAYGGCPNKSKCNLSTEEKIDMSSPSTLSPIEAALARIKSQQDGLAAGTVPPVVPPPPAALMPPPAPMAPPPPPPPPPPALPAEYHTPIRDALRAGHTVEAVAAHYKVSAEAVAALRAPAGRSPIESAMRPGEGAPSPSPDPRGPAPVEEHEAIKEAYAKGFTVVQIAHHFDASLVSVSALCPPAAPAPKVWTPGDPMNPAQDYLAAQGKPVDVIAMAADVSPPAGYAPITATVERGLINPPEAPTFAPREPGEMPPPVESRKQAKVTDELDALERGELKALAISLGYCGTESKLGAPGLRDLIRARRLEAGGDVPALLAPPVAPPASIQTSSAPVTPAPVVVAQSSPVPSGPVVFTHSSPAADSPLPEAQSFRLFVNCAPPPNATTLQAEAMHAELDESDAAALRSTLSGYDVTIDARASTRNLAKLLEAAREVYRGF